MTHEIRRVRVEECAYYVNKLRQNVGLETWIWRQIVTSQRPHITSKWPPYATEWNPPMKIFCVRHWRRVDASQCLFHWSYELDRLCPTRGLLVACSPVEGFVPPSLGFRCSKISYPLTTCPYNNLEFDIFDTGGLQCHTITSVTIAVRIRTLSGFERFQL